MIPPSESLCWPLSENGPLPAHLFDQEFLRRTFFVRGVGYWKCTSKSVRKGFKALGKKYGVGPLEVSAKDDLIDRDGALVFAICDNAEARAHLHNLEILVEQSGRGSGARIWSPKVEAFERTIWDLVYWDKDSEEEYTFAKWSMESCVARPELGDGQYFDPASLTAALAKNDCPVPTKELVFCRGIVLFAALLRAEERRALIEVAIRNGAEPLARLLIKQDPLIAKSKSDQGGLTEQAVLAPALRVSAIDDINAALEQTGETTETSLLAERLAAEAETFNDARAIYGNQTSSLVAKSTSEFDRAISLLRNARNARISRQDTEQLLEKTILEANEYLQSTIGQMDAESELRHSLPERLKRCAFAVKLVKKNAQKLAFIADWLEGQPKPFSLSTIYQLPQQITLVEQNRAAQALFAEEVAQFILSDPPTIVLVDWLKTLRAQEIQSLLQSKALEKWSVPSAVLIRMGIDAHAAVFVKELADWLISIDDLNRRRRLMRFIDPASASMDADTRLRRLVVTERLRDIITSGPMASIADPSAGLSDPSVVGRNVSSFVYLVAANLDYIQSQEDLGALLRQETPSGEAADAAITFALTPSNMVGHFKRVRELAREHVVLPVIQAGLIDSRAAREVIAEIESGYANQRVIKLFNENEKGQTKLEFQHEQQLSRYLQQARKLLGEALRKEMGPADDRRIKLAEELSGVVSQLASSGQIGQVAWLESQLREILTKVQTVDQSAKRTLIGQEDRVHERIWGSDDTVWARSELDLAVFYQPGDVSLVTVCIDALRAVARGTVPTSAEIAEQLTASGYYKEALEVAKGNIEEAKLKELRRRIDELIKPRVTLIESRLSGLAADFGSTGLQGSNYYREALASLRARDVDAADEQLELLAIDLTDLKRSELRDIENKEQKARALVVQRSLLEAGVSNFELDTPLAELEDLWARALAAHTEQRIHLSAISDIFSRFDRGVSEFSSFISSLDAFLVKQEQPAFWLTGVQARSVADYLKLSAAKLRTWAEVASILSAPNKRALAILFDVYLKFVTDTVQTLKAVSPTEEADSILERVIEFDELINGGIDPTACVQALIDAGEISNSVRAQVIQAVETSQTSIIDLTSLFRGAIAAKAWDQLTALTNNARETASDEHLKWIDEVGDFAKTMISIESGERPLADLLESSVRSISTAGHPVYRALDGRSQLTLAFKFLAASLATERPEIEVLKGESSNWTVLLCKVPDLFRTLNETSAYLHAGKVLEQLTAGALAFEVCERLWSSATGLPDAVAFRVELLRFLHDRQCQDAIVKLAARFDSTIRIRLERMLDLRAAAAFRPDLLPAADAVAQQVAAAAKMAPFRHFIKRLPSVGQSLETSLDVVVDDHLVLRENRFVDHPVVHVHFLVTARGMVPEQLQVQLFSEDDVSIAGRNGRVATLTEEILYAPTEFSVDVQLGASWQARLKNSDNDSFRLRISARTVTQEIVIRDATCSFRRLARSSDDARSIDNESILEFYPGVGNTPAEGSNFVGRTEEIEQLHSYLISSRHPSPVLLTGMRRIGKTSLLFELHRRFRNPGTKQAISVYLSIAEQRSALLSPEQTVAGAMFKAIVRALGKPAFPVADHNRAVGERLKSVLGHERNAVRVALERCYDAESFSDSLMILSEKLLEWSGGEAERVIFLIDEAETLILPYNQGGTKKVELEQFLQSLREVSQTTASVGLALSGSNHIVEFVREYKNAFFGSCARVDLGGITERGEAVKLIAPRRVSEFIQFDDEAVDYAVELCAGMPQFMWQVGAATACHVRSGPAVTGDVRAALQALVDERQDGLPFKPYDVLEPLEHMLKLQGDRERDLLWLLLRRVAVNSSLATLEVPRHFIIDQMLLELGPKEHWHRRLTQLVELDVLTTPQPQSYAFRVPIFAEAFRSSRNSHEQTIRVQRASL